jgi:hypothetical protein
MTKRAGDPSKVLRDTKISQWLKTSRENSWFVAGHTRLATRGKVNRQNSHPFRYGRIIGSHNGMCEAPNKFQVDSEYLFYSLNKHHGDYNKALADISGYWGLSWFDGSSFYLMSHNGDMGVVEIDGVWYYSSSWKHLDACTGGDCHTLGEGEVWQFNAKGLVGSSDTKGSGVEPFVSTGGKWGYYSQTSSYQGVSTRRAYGPARGRNVGAGDWWENRKSAGGAGTTTAPPEGDTAEVRDYDQEWVDAWGSYCEAEGSSVHALSDDEFEKSQYAD